jgi:1-acyl-sn-glycerol-3-phosphate acyltransferase
MINALFRLIFKLQGWKLDWNIPPEAQRCVLIGAPHTSNWDFVYMRAAFDWLKIPLRFTIKKEWLRFPLNLILEPMGALGIDRSTKKLGEPRPSMVEVMADLFSKYERLAMLITPEGTRKKNPQWKTGFYYVAQKAKVPIVCGYLDYKTKTAGMGLVIYPSDDFHADMKKIMQFYQNIQAKYPENFSIDERYLSE